MLDLEPLKDKSAAIRDELSALYDLEDALKPARQQAKRDNESDHQEQSFFSFVVAKELESPSSLALQLIVVDELGLKRREKEKKKATATKRGALPSTDIQELPQTTQYGRVTIAFVESDTHGASDCRAMVLFLTTK
ncbi:hypothetical protein PsorP6_001990 [Peronosclerospora sorghi]|uniref:Uncharacterized protein n=1 Tax=Peronosclerospora sorghi TaxID=230839 RepID=A0ACC0WVI9_9STRA|nr:hypothetical protein PsorP6_001990 [Peronosclerospora sorghi]